MKAYALVGAEHAPLRRSLLEFPWPRLYEHPWMNCALAIERLYRGEEGVFVGLFAHRNSKRSASFSRPSPGTRTNCWKKSDSIGWHCDSAVPRPRFGACCGGAP